MSLAVIVRQSTQEKVGQMEDRDLAATLLAPRQLRTDEVSFWHQVVADLLDCKLDPIENVANLKADLLKLRNSAVRCSFSLRLIYVFHLFLTLASRLVFLTSRCSR